MTIDEYMKTEEGVSQLWQYAWKNGHAAGVEDGEENAIEALFDLLSTELICEWMNDNTTWCDERCQWAEPCYRCIHEYIEAKGNEPRKPITNVLWGKDAVD